MTSWFVWRSVWQSWSYERRLHAHRLSLIKGEISPPVTYAPATLRTPIWRRRQHAKMKGKLKRQHSPVFFLAPSKRKEERMWKSSGIQRHRSPKVYLLHRRLVGPRNFLIPCKYLCLVQGVTSPYKASPNLIFFQCKLRTTDRKSKTPFFFFTYLLNLILKDFSILMHIKTEVLQIELK